MNNMIDFVNKFGPKISQRDDIAGRLKKFHDIKELIQVSTHCFNVTDLCSPTDAFAEQKLGKQKSQRLKDIQAEGKKIHAIVQNWLKQHKDYCGSESILDGNFVGISARGKIDGRINESIVEIKSIGKLPERYQDIIEKYPQYIEQVAFYSAIDPLTPKYNYLVFITKDYPRKIKSFGMSISDFEEIKKVLKKRIYLFKEVLEGKKEAKTLGKCRFCYEKDCNLKNEEKCFLSELQPLGCEVIDHIKLSEDADFTSELNNLRKKYGDNYQFFSAYNILCPRKYCLKSLYDLEEDFNDPLSTAKAYFENLVYRFIKSEESFTEKKDSKFAEFGLSKYGWFNDKNSLSPDGKKTPFITYVTDYLSFDRPVPYKIAELGIYLMAHGLDRGMIFTYYPEKNKIKVFEVTFDFKGDYLSVMRDVINRLKDSKNFLLLPECPNYMCEHCIFLDKCK
jgi:hypothetical protein